MRKYLPTLLVILSITVFPLTAGDEVPEVVKEKCVKCHFVTTYNIETTKKDPSKATDLANAGNAFATRDEMKSFLLKELEKDGELHKTKFKGDDAAMEALLDWLATLKQE